MTEKEAIINGVFTEEQKDDLEKRLSFCLPNEILLADVSKMTNVKLETPGLYLSDKERETHMHVMGSSGGGKSKLLEFMIRQDIQRGVGVCIIDPHGELYWNILRYIICEGSEEVWNKTYLMNPSQEDYMISYNPLIMKRGDHKSHSLRLVECLDKVFDGEISEKSGLNEALISTFKTSAIKGYSTHQAKKLFLKKEFREELVDSFSHSPLGDDELQEFWIKSVNSKVFDDILFWSKTKFSVLSESTPLERMTLQNNTIDLREVIQNDGILLVNLADSDIFNKKSSRTLGTMLISELISNFKGDTKRTEAFITGEEPNIKPFFMYVDEFHEVYTDDFKDILTGLRKFGLHLVLANQEFSQLTDEMKTTIKSVGAKAYFPVRDYHEAKEIFIQMGIYRDKVKYQYETFSSLPIGYSEIPSESTTINSSGGMSTTTSKSRIQSYSTQGTIHKQFYSPEEIMLMEGKKIQLLPARNFLFHSSRFDEGVFLKTDWVFNYPLKMETIEAFHLYVANEHPEIYEKVSVLDEKLRQLNAQYNSESENTFETEDDNEIDNPFN